MSFSVSTDPNWVCPLPQVIDEINDLKLPEGASNTESQQELFEAAKSAAKDIIESGAIGVKDGDEATGFNVTISGHSNEQHGLGESLNVSISTATPTPTEKEDTPSPETPESDPQPDEAPPEAPSEPTEATPPTPIQD